MYYYDYTSYFQTLISKSEIIINNQTNLFNCLCIIIFLFTIFFIYYFIRNMIKS